MEAIRGGGARFQSLSEPWADTTTHAGKLIMTVFAGIAEFERDLIRERVSAGIRNARANGKKLGRPKTLVDRAQVLQLRERGQSLQQIATKLGIGYGTVRSLLLASHEL